MIDLAESELSNESPVSKIYRYEEAYKESIEYFNGSEIATSVFIDKYALRNDLAQLIESNPDQMHWRFAKEFARIEKSKFEHPYSEEEIYGFFKDFKRLMCQGSPSYGIGNKYQYVTLSNCYVIESPEDSYGGILKADEELVQISKRRGGVGTDLSKLRPHNSRTRNSSRTSTGPITFGKRYSNSIREVGQDGRRGALMLTLDIHHPDCVYVWDKVEDGEPYNVHISDKDLGEFDVSSEYYNPKKIDFCTCKYDKKSITGANISIKLSDEFLSAVENGTDFQQRWPLIDPKIIKQTNARKAWDKIIHSAWRTAEPGLLFWDTILRESPANCYTSFGFAEQSTNPCSELPLPALDSCRLMLLNAFGFVVDPFKSSAYFDWEMFYKYVRILQRMMDNLVDLEKECIERIIVKIQEDPEQLNLKKNELELWQRVLYMCENGRRTGSGLTAVGDTLAALNIGYGTEDGISFTEKLYKVLKLGAYTESISLAKELGPFPIWNYDLEKDNPFLNRIKEDSFEELNLDGKAIYDDMTKYGRRNIALLTTAPVGTGSIIAKLDKLFGTSSGIEPEYSDEGYIRRKKINHSTENSRVDFEDQTGDKWQNYKVYPSAIQEYIDITGDSELKKSPFKNNTAEKLDWKLRVRLQAAAQKHIDHAISSTVNLPSDVTVDKVKEIYETAWKYGCKGITVYRDGCRTGILTKDTKNSSITRPKELPCDVHHIKIKGQEYFIFVGLNNNRPYEIFAGKNGHIDRSIKKGVITKIKAHYKVVFDDGSEIPDISKDVTDTEEALTRLISLLLRNDVLILDIVKQLERTDGDIYDFAKSISRSLKKYIEDGTKDGDICPDCSNELIRESGCVVCKSCGWTKCS